MNLLLQHLMETQPISDITVRFSEGKVNSNSPTGNYSAGSRRLKEEKKYFLSQMTIW